MFMSPFSPWFVNSLMLSLEHKHFERLLRHFWYLKIFVYTYSLVSVRILLNDIDGNIFCEISTSRRVGLPLACLYWHQVK